MLSPFEKSISFNTEENIHKWVQQGPSLRILNNHSDETTEENKKSQPLICFDFIESIYYRGYLPLDYLDIPQ